MFQICQYYQGRAGIISLVRWNLRPVIFLSFFGVEKSLKNSLRSLKKIVLRLRRLFGDLFGHFLHPKPIRFQEILYHPNTQKDMCFSSQYTYTCVKTFEHDYHRGPKRYMHDRYFSIQKMQIFHVSYMSAIVWNDFSWLLHAHHSPICERGGTSPCKRYTHEMLGN